jgi:hypothetical protein
MPVAASKSATRVCRCLPWLFVVNRTVIFEPACFFQLKAGTGVGGTAVGGTFVGGTAVGLGVGVGVALGAHELAARPAAITTDISRNFLRDNFPSRYS